MINKDYVQKLLDYISDSDIDKSKFGPFYNLILLPLAQISEPVEYRLQRVEDFQGITNFSSLSDKEIEIAASNHLIFRKEGSVGTGYARVVVKTKTDLTLLAGTKLFILKDGVRLEFETQGVSFVSADFTVSTRYPNYFISPAFSITTTSKDADYNTLSAYSALQNTLANSNIVTFVLDYITSPVVTRESNIQLYNRLVNQAGARQLNNEIGITTLFNEYFPNVPVIAVYGNNDEFVTRNQVIVFAPSPDEEWTVLNFKGKQAGSISIPHFAFEYMLTSSGVEFTNSDDQISLEGLNSPTNFLLYEAAQTDYNAIQAKLSEDYFETGHGMYLSKDTFVTDTAWVKSDALLGYNKLFTPFEIIISGTQYILGGSDEDAEFNQFIRDLMRAHIRYGRERDGR